MVMEVMGGGIFAKTAKTPPLQSGLRGDRRRIFGHHLYPCRVEGTFSGRLLHQILPVKTEWLYLQ